MILPSIVLLGVLVASPAAFAAGGGVSVDEGGRVAKIGGCHDCHTAGYAESGGQLDPQKALTGSPVGFQGPWGTTYPSNLRIALSKMGEDEFVTYGHSFKTRPPMPWFSVHAMTDDELRSFYQYVKSLGDLGDPAPEYVPPGDKPVSPFIVFAPPQMP